MARIDDYDYEVKYAKDEKIEVGFMVNFKSMSVMINRIVEETKEVTDQYPKSELKKIWGGIMFCYLILFALSYQILIVATLPFAILYTYTLFQLFKAWKGFKYPMKKLVWSTIGIVILDILLSIPVRLLMGFVLDRLV